MVQADSAICDAPDDGLGCFHSLEPLSLPFLHNINFWHVNSYCPLHVLLFTSSIPFFFFFCVPFPFSFFPLYHLRNPSSILPLEAFSISTSLKLTFSTLFPQIRNRKANPKMGRIRTRRMKRVRQIERRPPRRRSSNSRITLSKEEVEYPRLPLAQKHLCSS